MKTIKKAQKGTKMMSPAKKKAAVDSVPSEMFPGKMIPRSALQDVVGPSTYNKTKAKAKPAPKKKMKSGGIMKAKSGKSFPDLTGDGKVTRADVLKGRGVIKNGGKLKKAMGGGKCKNGC
jgi:hypothetical protein